MSPSEQSQPAKAAGATETTSARCPLDGVRVIEAASYVSGPFAGLMLGHLGADVVKVEPPTGDPLRRFNFRHRGLSALWVNINHAKSSRAVDLKSEPGRKIMRALLADADVFLENWRPGVTESLGLDDATLEEINPRLIHLGITGFGSSGPDADAAVFDGLLQAASGLAAMESSDGRPRALRSYVADKVTALIATQSVLAALLERDRTGRGTRIDLSMLDAMAYFNFPDLCQDRTFLDPTAKRDLPRGRSGVLTTLDGHVSLAPVSGRQIGAAVTAAGHPEWKDELKQIVDPVQLTDTLFERLESVTPTRSTAEWLMIFRDHDVPVAPVLTADQHFVHPQTVHNEIYSEGHSPVGPVRRVRHPARFDRTPLAQAGPPPDLGSGDSQTA